MSDGSQAPAEAQRADFESEVQTARKRRMRAAPLTPQQVLERLKNGLNVKVPDFAPCYGDSEAAIYRQIREKKLEAVRVGRSLYLTARVAGPLVGIEPIAA
ncbi:hypothetical protein MKK67_09815 [Methylobacterium sp. J-072]|uniref:hypothetical protein n=1 Tax=Methylobacterium sp. J-072 TaxID=2836651 RepID=UPI001FBB4BF9|nr:hypothetical protein [Methylobacterium sp. J-072]MCJ2092795.1 hypothetical protein [Methylobacterium sp. J-072]